MLLTKEQDISMASSFMKSRFNICDNLSLCDMAPNVGRMCDIWLKNLSLSDLSFGEAHVKAYMTQSQEPYNDRSQCFHYVIRL